jgi:hypothetical protein
MGTKAADLKIVRDMYVEARKVVTTAFADDTAPIKLWTAAEADAPAAAAV